MSVVKYKLMKHRVFAALIFYKSLARKVIMPILYLYYSKMALQASLSNEMKIK